MKNVRCLSAERFMAVIRTLDVGADAGNRDFRHFGYVSQRYPKTFGGSVALFLGEQKVSECVVF